MSVGNFRKKQPLIRPVHTLHLPKPQLYHLSNGIPVYDINMGPQPLVKVDIIFRAGRPFEKKKLVAQSTFSLLNEGSQHYSASEIAATFDYYGASLNKSGTLDFVNLTIYSLRRHLSRLLPIVTDMLLAPLFDERELEVYKKRKMSQVREALSNSDLMAFKLFTESIFGVDHPYGYNTKREYLENLTRDDLVQHFSENFTASNCIVIVSGKTGESVRQLLEKHLGLIPRGPFREAHIPPPRQKPEHIFKQKKGTSQYAIRLGRPLFNRKHPDYNGMNVLCTLLGGYFGSRLMENIREQKGYTYGISASLETMLYSGYFYIECEVGKNYLQPSLEEIYRELRRLQNEPVTPNELQMVRNYLFGNLLTNLDGPFNIAELVKSIVQEQLPFEYFDQMLEVIQKIQPEDLQALAKRYLSPQDLWEVVVG